ncbi:hypothetical protein AB0C38_36410 [Amycolatopsis sp. NPDC048633]|uniref:terpene synthase family protein n=1 Tax=Amycolatopsis sp. NPDC048633 TaxID=3157095 RepID=UPI0034066E61
MPEFYCPIRPAESPYAASAEQDALDWLEKFQIFETPAQGNYFARSRFPLFPSKALPDAADAVRLSLPGKEVVWLQSFDDVHSDERPGGALPPHDYITLLSKLTRIIEDPAADVLPGNRWADALRDLRLAVAENASPVQVDRWIHATTEYFAGLLWEAVNRAENRVPTLNDYVAMWLKQSGVYPCIVFTDIACGYEVSAADWSGPKVRQLREIVSAIIGWDNDLTSYDKEVHRSAEHGFPLVQNLVSVLQSEFACDADEAVALTGSMRDRAMARFLRLRDEVSAYGNDTVTRYVHGLGQWVRAYLDYSGASPRYMDPDNPDDAAVTNRSLTGWTIVNTRKPERSDLPSIPCIDSWWA